ncbi:MAG: hypothetical protein ABI999_05165 [Acidobacteriota bacterium]
MKNKFFFLLLLAAAALAVSSCSFSTANMSSFKTSKDADGKQDASSFKAGETIYANAVIANAPGKVTVKMYLTPDSDGPGTKKGEALPGSEVKVDLPGSGTAKYSLPIPTGMKSGKFTVVAEMLNETGEKKDSKSAAVTIEAGAASPVETHKDDKPAGKDDKDKDKDDDDN